jgi:hypothetical protein
MDLAYRDSLHRRLRAMHSLYVDALASMEIDHVNHVERHSVLPIAFSLVHQVLLEDGAVAMAGGPAPLFDDAWSHAIRLGVADHGKERRVDEMMSQRIGDLDAFARFQSRVFARTEEYVAGLEPHHFDEVLIAAPYPPMVANTFSARVGGDAGITRSDALECWVYQHGLRHMGEIEHGRALVGLGGMTS